MSTDKHLANIIEALGVTSAEEACAAVQGLITERDEAHTSCEKTMDSLGEANRDLKLSKRYKREADKAKEDAEARLDATVTRSMELITRLSEARADCADWKRMALLFAGLVEQAGLMGSGS